MNTFTQYEIVSEQDFTILQKYLLDLFMNDSMIEEDRKFATIALQTLKSFERLPHYVLPELHQIVSRALYEYS
jgi:hypothetical protein